ncbi:MAG: hypothetical protein ACYTG7_19325 [Planctomycetota bacterium]
METASLDVKIRYAKDHAIEPELWVALIRLEEGQPKAFANLERPETAGAGEALYKASTLIPGSYRLEARWLEYLCTLDGHEIADESKPDQIEQLRPLPQASREIRIESGHQEISLDLIHDLGFFIFIKDLPEALEDFIRVEVAPQEGGKPYFCRLSRLPLVLQDDPKYFFLPLFQGANKLINLAGVVPDWMPPIPVVELSQTTVYQLAFPSSPLGSVELSIFYPSGEPVAGVMHAQRTDWGDLFMREGARMEMTNLGGGKRVLPCLPQGEWRFFFTWQTRDETLHGAFELCEIRISGDVQQRILFDPAAIFLDAEHFSPGKVRVRIREADSERIVSRSEFEASLADLPYCLVSLPGIYVAEAILDNEAYLVSDSFRIEAGDKKIVALMPAR